MPGERRDEDLEEAEDVPAEDRARDAAEAADDRGDERLEDGREAHVRVDLAGLDGIQEARDRRQPGADGEGRGDDPVDLDAHQLGRVRSSAAARIDSPSVVRVTNSVSSPSSTIPATKLDDVHLRDHDGAERDDARERPPAPGRR